MCSYQAELPGPVAHEDRHWIIDSIGCGLPKSLAQPFEHRVERLHLPDHVVEELGADLTRSNGVRHSRRRPRVVLEDQEAPVAVAHEVEADHRGGAGADQALHLGLEILGAFDHPCGDHALGDDSALAVDVGQERVQGTRTLG